MPNAKWHHGGICGNLASRLLPSVKQQLPVRGTVGWQLQRKISFSLLSSFIGSLQLQPKLFLWSPPSAEDHDVLVPPSHYPVKATSHNKPTTSHKAAGHAHTFTIEVARDTALCSEIAFILTKLHSSIKLHLLQYVVWCVVCVCSCLPNTQRRFFRILWWGSLVAF